MQPASQITCWWPAQRLALNTKAQYRSLLIHHVLPSFGDRPLASITSPEQIAAWEIALYEQPQPPGGKPLSVNSARKVPQAARAHPQRRGDRGSGHPQRGPRSAAERHGGQRGPAAAAGAGQEPWTNQVQALLIAERVALLSAHREVRGSNLLSSTTTAGHRPVSRSPGLLARPRQPRVRFSEPRNRPYRRGLTMVVAARRQRRRRDHRCGQAHPPGPGRWFRRMKRRCPRGRGQRLGCGFG